MKKILLAAVVSCVTGACYADEGDFIWSECNKGGCRLVQVLEITRASLDSSLKVKFPAVHRDGFDPGNDDETRSYTVVCKNKKKQVGVDIADGKTTWHDVNLSRHEYMTAVWQYVCNGVAIIK